MHNGRDEEKFHAQTVERFASILMGVGEQPCMEMRVFHATWDRGGRVVPAQQYSKTLGGWYTDPGSLAYDAHSIRGVSAYVTINPVNPDLRARSYNKLGKLVRGSGTTDDDIVKLSWLYIDIDPVRPADVSATEGERAAALERRDQILDEITGLRETSFWGCSGNGGWILARLPDWPNDAEHRGIVGQTLLLLAARFNDERVTVDVKTKNPARVMCLPGTLKCKGSDIPERPHRLVTIDGMGEAREAFDAREWLAGQGATYMSLAPAAPVPASPSATHAGRVKAVDREFIKRRAREYLQRFDPAIQGQNGSDQTFDAACTLILRFDLTVDEARPLLREYSARCVPPWSDQEIEHKLEDADARPGPRGDLIPGNDAEWRAEQAAKRLQMVVQPPNEGPDGGDVTEGQEDNPHRLARLFMMSYYGHADGRTLNYWFDQFYEWDSGVYLPLTTKEIKGRISNFLEAEFRRIYGRRLMEFGMSQAAGDGPSRKMPELLKATTFIVSNVVQALAGLCLLPAKECPRDPSCLGSFRGDWEADDILPAMNCLVNVKRLIRSEPHTRDHTPLYFSTNRLDYDFDENPEIPVNWMTFLGSIPIRPDSPVQFAVWPDDPESIDTLQEWFGLNLLADTSYQKIMALIGATRSGKGTIAAVLAGLIGERNVAGPTLHSLGEKFGLESLIGRKSAVIDDMRIGPKTDLAVAAERLLSISGEGRLSVPRKFGSDWIGKLPTKITILSNEIPRLNDQSGALPGRFIILRFTRSFRGKEDNHLVDKILPELPGILAWSIEGLRRLEARGRFSQPASGAEMSSDMGSLSSPVAAFLEDRCEVGAGHSVVCSTLYHAWVDWCHDNGRKETGESSTFGRNLRSVIPDLRTIQPREGDGRKQIRKYFGVGLRDDCDGRHGVTRESLPFPVLHDQTQPLF